MKKLIFIILIFLSFIGISISALEPDVTLFDLENTTIPVNDGKTYAIVKYGKKITEENELLFFNINEKISFTMEVYVYNSETDIAKDLLDKIDLSNKDKNILSSQPIRDQTFFKVNLVNTGYYYILFDNIEKKLNLRLYKDNAEVVLGSKNFFYFNFENSENEDDFYVTFQLKNIKTSYFIMNNETRGRKEGDPHLKYIDADPNFNTQSKGDYFSVIGINKDVFYKIKFLVHLDSEIYFSYIEKYSKEFDLSSTNELFQMSYARNVSYLLFYETSKISKDTVISFIDKQNKYNIYIQENDTVSENFLQTEIGSYHFEDISVLYSVKQGENNIAFYNTSAKGYKKKYTNIKIMTKNETIDFTKPIIYGQTSKSININSVINKINSLDALTPLLIKTEGINLKNNDILFITTTEDSIFDSNTNKFINTINYTKDNLPEYIVLYNENKTFGYTVEIPTPSNEINSNDSSSSKLGLIIGISVGVVLIVAIIIILIICFKKKKNCCFKEKNQNDTKVKKETEYVNTSSEIEINKPKGIDDNKENFENPENQNQKQKQNESNKEKLDLPDDGDAPPVAPTE